MKPYYKTIGFEPDWPEPAERFPVLAAQHFVGCENYSPGYSLFGMQQDIYTALEVVAYRHLGLPEAPDADPWIQKGLDCALYFFLDDPGGGPGKESMAVFKKKGDASVSWSESFSRGLILGLLSKREDDVSRLCTWPWSELTPEYSGMGGDLEDEVALMYIVVAASLRPPGDPLAGLEKITAKIRKCRTKRPRLLMKLWDAVEARDQDAYAKALAQSLKHHASGKKIENSSAQIADRLALAQTAITLAALRHGLAIPDLPPELAAYLITRESIALPPWNGKS